MTSLPKRKEGRWEPVRAETNKGSRFAGARVREGEVSDQPTEPRLPRATPQSTATAVESVEMHGLA
jgi:hypothetical protein